MTETKDITPVNAALIAGYLKMMKGFGDEGVMQFFNEEYGISASDAEKLIQIGEDILNAYSHKWT